MATHSRGASAPVSQYSRQRFCQTLRLKNDPASIAQYKYWHSAENCWPEIPQGIRTVGIVDMEIYIHHDLLFMIIETEKDFDWDCAFGKLATLPRQAEWEGFVSQFQLADPQASSSQKWQRMERIFKL
ncbi:MAG: L-rhamnose mutarotase [Paludibacteraceae bacterium]|nr:L-rhamnose mutarotase [Paludibacteraceae bacterium]